LAHQFFYIVWRHRGEFFGGRWLYALGQKFAAGGLFGVLDGKAPTARINAIWADTSCNF
jgi:hypothetical protein